MQTRIVFVVNSIRFFASHRMAIGLELIRLGHSVHVVTPDESLQFLLDKGFKCHKLSMSRKGHNPLNEFRTIYELYSLFKDLKPDLVHLITIKPYLYGGIAARLAMVPSVVTAIAGLGLLFSENNKKNQFLKTLLYPLYKYALSHPNQKIIFQNSFDKSQLLNWKVLSEEKSFLIRGSGVDLSEYSFKDEPEGVPIVSFASRLLKNKGVVEFVDASRILKRRGVQARFWLIGEPDPGNSYSVTVQEIAEWEGEGLVEYLGYRTDIPELFAKSAIITLPSYYGEGLPKVLVEAAACGRVVVTTDHPGCSDAIDPESGVLIPIKNSLALANALEVLLSDPVKRKKMGLAGRELAEKEFSIEKIVQHHLDIYRHILKGKV